MVDEFKAVEAAYSLGICDDVSWDIDIALRGVPLFQYDPTIECLPAEHDLFNWHPIWIGGHSDPAENRDTLENIVKNNGHEQSRDLLLKCDIEESEWPLLQQTPNRVLQQFRQMVFEIHTLAFLADSHHGNNVRRALLNLTASHHVVHVHANNFAGWNVVGGVPIPSVLELTLMRKDAGDFVVSNEIFPTDMDMPCNPDAADLFLGNFVY